MGPILLLVALIAGANNYTNERVDGIKGEVVQSELIEVKGETAQQACVVFIKSQGEVLGLVGEAEACTVHKEDLKSLAGKMVTVNANNFSYFEDRDEVESLKDQYDIPFYYLIDDLNEVIDSAA